MQPFPIFYSLYSDNLDELYCSNIKYFFCNKIKINLLLLLINKIAVALI